VSSAPSDAAKARWKALCMESDAHPRRTGVKIRLKAIDRVKEMLREDLGIEADHVWSNKGYWSHAHQDVMRWEFTGYTFEGVTTTGGSYDSMTTCAKTGMKLVWLKDRFDGEICAVKRP
jgi:hypothetical protein